MNGKWKKEKGKSFRFSVSHFQFLRSENAEAE